MLGSEREAPPTEDAPARTTGATATWLQSLLLLRRQRRALARSLPRMTTACGAAAAAGEAAKGLLLPWQGVRETTVSKRDLTLQPSQRGSQQKQPKHDSRDHDRWQPLSQQRLTAEVLGACGVAPALSTKR